MTPLELAERARFLVESVLAVEDGTVPAESVEARLVLASTLALTAVALILADESVR